ncbi:MAG: M20 family metallo-hydrolase [Bryobacteraceae bacterium]|jgi:N-carbamoyl-L-amino-acid hydrolase
MNLAVDGGRLTAELEELAAISSEPAPVVTRVVFSEADLRARDLVKRWFREGGLEVREDPVGNTFARWRGTHPDLPAVATGSHIDAIPNAGRYDGTVGVLGGLEAIRALMRSGFEPRRSLDLIVFTAEEPTRFGIGCLGSRLMAGTLDASCDDTMRDREGASLSQVRRGAGFSGPLAAVRLNPGYYAAFVELHIEQGPLLERRGTDIGVVTAIAAPASLRVSIEGEGGHAGAVLMADRRDAFPAAAELALAVERAASSTGSPDTVATVGVCRVFPGAINSIPSRADLEIDVRDIDGLRRDAALAEIEQAARRICSARKVSCAIELINADPPAGCAPELVSALEAASEALGLRWEKMPSRAYHDSLFMSRIAPTAMLFIPCRGGVSHRPDEYASPESIERGVWVLAHALVGLAG